MVQALRSFKLWNKLRKYLGGSHGSNDNPKRKTKSSLGAPFWAQMIGLVFFVAVFSVGCYYLFISVFEGEDILQSRQLRNGMCSGTEDDDKDEDCPSGASHPALLIVYFFGVFYLFIGIAIVCDEFFVASLEQIGIYLDLSDDVCGATLMAAGGSAPELATSLIGTFKGSDVGFGTIVGSAVFNVLFVIACCVMSTPKELAPLELTGWPLARDCCFYSITLVAVAICFGASSPGKIEGWEAVFLFSLYLTYVVLMKFNDKLYLYFNPPGVIAPVPDSCSDSTEKLTNLERTTPLEESDVASGGGDSLLNKTDTATAHPHHHVINGVAGEHHKNQSVNICPSHFRAGFFHLITQETITDTSGVAILNKIKGDVKESFDALDKDKSGTIDIHELKELMAMLSHGVTGPQDITDEMVTPVMKALDLDNNGSIDFSEFTVWYVDSEERLRNETQIAWAKIDSDHSGIPLSNLEKLFTEMELVVTQERLDEIRLHFLVNTTQLYLFLITIASFLLLPLNHY